MHQLEINLNNNSYPILINKGIDKMLNNLFDKSNYSNIFIITQQSIFDNVKNNFLSNYPTIIVDENEASKSVTTAEFVVQELLKEGCDRESLLIGFGGGTITDLTGFVASIFMRGIDHVFIPTTLLGMVDASIGGKTAVNSNQVRNLIGTFKHPKGIYIDPLFLNTLPKKDIIDGFAEVIKYGLIVDMELYNMVESNFKELIELKDLNQIETIISKCCNHKATFVANDQFDYNERMILNFGHTIGHALESYFNYKKVTHGQAVYYGMMAAAFISKKKGLLSGEKFNQIYTFIFSILDLQIQDIDCNQVCKLIKYDKKRTKNKNYFIVLNDIGKAGIVKNVTTDDIKEAITFIANYEYSCN
tara:strand:- start:1240 stop:2319 length:1080 start_codon:yes stop_codon:yes gene_type:complete